MTLTLSTALTAITGAVIGYLRFRSRQQSGTPRVPQATEPGDGAIAVIRWIVGGPAAVAAYVFGMGLCALAGKKLTGNPGDAYITMIIVGALSGTLVGASVVPRRHWRAASIAFATMFLLFMGYFFVVAAFGGKLRPQHLIDLVGTAFGGILAYRIAKSANAAR